MRVATQTRSSSSNDGAHPVGTLPPTSRRLASPVSPRAEHPSKRVKREHSGRDEVSQDARGIEPASHNLGTDSDGNDPPSVDIEALAAQAAKAVMSSRHTQTVSKTSMQSDLHAETSKQEERKGGSDHLTGNALISSPGVDFSSAPSDPIELALWVARQISSFQQTGSNEMESTERSRNLEHPPALYTRRSYDDDDPVKAAERERQREENRERKKRWRESNSERNKDNDLRCRINKRAKQIWGSRRPAERSVWMEAEFNKRRAKRESKERFRFFEDGFPGFTFAPGFGSSLFPTPGVGPQGETNAAGLLLANALLGVGSNGQGPNASAAKALKSALDMGTVDPRPFTEALRAMAANPDIMNGINALLGASSSGYDDGDLNSGEDEGNLAGSFTETVQHEREQARLVDDSTNNKESEIVRALNAATAMLNEMNEARREDVSGEGNQDGMANGVGAAAAEGSGMGDDGRRRLGEEEQSGDRGLDQAQIDALLAMTTGQRVLGDLDDEDESFADDGGGGGHDGRGATESQEGPGGDHQPDSDISATLQHIIQQVMAQRGGGGGEQANHMSSLTATEENEAAAGAAVAAHQPRPAMPSQTTSITTTTTTTATANPTSQRRSDDPFGITRNPALALSSLLQCAGMSINTVIPAAQSHATSQLYARLSDHHQHHHHQQHAYSSAFSSSMSMSSSGGTGGGINPAHASAYGSTAAMNQRLLARPNAFTRPLHHPGVGVGVGGVYVGGASAGGAQGGTSVDPSPSPTETSTTTAAAIQELERKKRSFGFPPFPGQRIGGKVGR